MNRAVYDRIRPSISPFNVGSGVDASAAPPEMRAAFGNASEDDSALDSAPNLTPRRRPGIIAWK